MSEDLDKLEDRGIFMSRCVRCSQCKFIATPKSHAFASACPSIDWGQFHSFSASGQLIIGEGLLEGKIEPSVEVLQSVFSCTMCGACDTSCKVNLGETVEPLDSLYALRAHLASQGHSPKAHKTIVKNLIARGNGEGIARDKLAEWAEGLGLGPKTSGPDGVLLHVGEELSCREASWPALRTIVAAIAAAGVALAHSGAREVPSGGLAFDLGHVDEARSLAREMQALVRESGASTLVTFSAEALAAFRALYPRLGLAFGEVRVLHITEYLEELCETGRIFLRSIHECSVTYHDPCKLGRLSERWKRRDREVRTELRYYVSRDRAALRFGNEGCYDAPRALIRRLGLQLVELERSRESSYCCGAGGGVAQTNPAAARTAADSRLQEIASTGVELCVTACSGCQSHLNAAGLGDAAAPQVVQLLDLVAEALGTSASN